MKWPPHPPNPPPHPPQPSNPAAPPPRDLAFIALADWGGQTDWPMTTLAQTQCASAMNSVTKQLQVQFILSAGDNFYDTGIQGARSRARGAQCSAHCRVGLLRCLVVALRSLTRAHAQRRPRRRQRGAEPLERNLE